MPPVVIPEAALAVVQGTVYGQTWVNVIGLRVDDTIEFNQTNADSLGLIVRGIYTDLTSLLVNDWSLGSIVIQDLRTGTAPAWETDQESLVGANISDGMPPHVAAVATHRTGLRGRSFRGRTYLAGFGEDSNTTTGQILQLTRDTIATAFTDFRSALNTTFPSTINHAVVSRTLATTTLVTASTADAEWDRQNRRKRVS